MIGIKKISIKTTYTKTLIAFLLGQIATGSAVATNVGAAYIADSGGNGPNVHDVLVFDQAVGTLRIGSAGDQFIGLVDNSDITAAHQAAVVSSAAFGSATIDIGNGSIVTNDGSAVINFSGAPLLPATFPFGAQGASPGVPGTLSIRTRLTGAIKNQNPVGIDNPIGIAITLANQNNVNLTLTNESGTAIVGNIYGSNLHDTLNLAGTIQGNIFGGTSGNNTINITGDFTTNGTIDKIETINVNNNAAFNIKKNITNLTTLFNTTAGTTTTISTGGSINGALGRITNAGKLVLSGTSRIGNLAAMGAVTNTDTITLGGGNVDVGAFDNTGSSVTISSGAVNVGGAFTNINGNLAVNSGNLTAGAFNNTGGNLIVNSGGIAIVGNFTNGNGGTVSINGLTSTINGAYNSNTATSTHIANIVNGVAQTLAVTGAADLSNSTIKIATSGNTIAGEAVDIITCTAPPNIAGTKLTISTNSPIINYALSISGHNVQISANRVTPTTINNSTAYTTGSIVNSGLDNNQFSSDAKSVFSMIDQETNIAAITKDYNQLSPDINSAQGLQTASFEASSIAIAASAERLELIARGGITDIKTGYAAGGMQSSEHLWIKGLGGTFLQKQYKDSVGYNTNVGGSAIGMDSKINNHTWIGASLSYANTHIKTRDFPANRTVVNSYQATIYRSYSLKKYYVDLFLALAFNKYKTERNITFANRVATGRFNGMQPSGKVASGYIHAIDNFRIIPNVSLQYTLLHQAKYDEQGAGGVGLQQVSSSDTKKLEGGVGIKFALLHKYEHKFFSPEIHFMILRDFDNTNQETTAQFTGGGGNFTVTGAKPAKTTYNVGVGLTYVNNDRLHCTFNYDLNTKSKFLGYSGSLALKYMI